MCYKIPKAMINKKSYTAPGPKISVLRHIGRDANTNSILLFSSVFLHGGVGKAARQSSADGDHFRWEVGEQPRPVISFRRWSLAERRRTMHHGGCPDAPRSAYSALVRTVVPDGRLYRRAAASQRQSESSRRRYDDAAV